MMALRCFTTVDRDLVYARIYARTADRHLTEDLTQDTLLRAMRSAHTYRGGNVEAWLSRIARSVVIDHVRSRVRRPETLRGDLDDSAHTTESAESVVVRGSVTTDLLTEVTAAIKSLPYRDYVRVFGGRRGLADVLENIAPAIAAEAAESGWRDVT